MNVTTGNDGDDDDVNVQQIHFSTRNLSINSNTCLSMYGRFVNTTGSDYQMLVT